MSRSTEVRHGIAVCETCETIQPVEIRHGEEIRGMGNPNCECGSNDFRLME